MPKPIARRKTKKAVAKRFKITGTGKVLSSQSGRRHLAGSKNRKRKRHLSKMKLTDKTDLYRIPHQGQSALRLIQELPMPRTTNAPASRERRKRVIQKAKGYRGRRSKLFRYAKDATMKGQYWAYRDRKTRKRNFRNLWVVRINAAVRSFDMTYSRFIEALAKAKIDIDRKILADLAVNEPQAFAAIVQSLKKA